jgi:hypothetical protein
MPKSPKDLEKWNMMLDQLADMYPGVASQIDELQSALADETDMSSEDEMPSDNVPEDESMSEEPAMEEDDEEMKY